MKKWYKESYFNKQAWILENMEKLHLGAKETLLLLLVDHAQKNHISLSSTYLCEKLQIKDRELDDILSTLVSKHYLKIVSSGKGVVFDIDELFEFDTERYEASENEDVYNTLDIVFGRPLSTSELQKASDLIAAYGQQSFLEALRLADGARKLNMAYIEGILRNHEKK